MISKKNRESISPVQPYFVLNTSHYMKKKMVGGTISHFYKFKAEETINTATMVIPDGSIDILFKCNPNSPDAKVCGSVSSSTALKIQKDTYYFGIRFNPGMIPKVFDVSASELLDREVEFVDIIKSHEVFEDIISESNFEKQIDIIFSSFSDKLEERVMVCNPYLVPEVIKIICDCGGNVKIDELAELTNYSERYINKLFKQSTGISPKMFCRFMRFQKSIQYINSGNCRNLADISVDMGYYDQSHFLQNFKEYTSMTPKQYIKTIIPENYQYRIIYY